MIVVVALIAAIAWGRLRDASGPARNDLQMLGVDSTPLPAANAWHTLWLLGYVIPPNEAAAAYAADLATARARLAASRNGTNLPPFTKAAESKYAALPRLTPDDDAALCKPIANCLARIRTHPDATRLAVTRHAERLAQVKTLADDTYLWNDMPAVPGLPTPDFDDVQTLWLTSAAIDFAEGHQADAVAATCTSALAMRRLHAGGNDLLGTLVAARWATDASILLLDMVSEMPADAVLPPVCQQAFAPPTTADVSLCEAVRFTWRATLGSAVDFPVVGGGGGLAARLRPALVSRVQTRRLAAPSYAFACNTATLASQLADQRLPDTVQPRPDPDLVDELANPWGVDVARVTVPDFVSYLRRTEDFAATLRLVATALWLRDQRGDLRTLATRLAMRPAALRTPEGRDIKAGPDGISLRMPLYVPAGGVGELSVPLPISP